MASLRGELKHLGTSSIVYLVPNILLRGLTFLLTPVYARAMPPGDYGALGVATTIGSIASVALCLSLHGSVSRLHFEYKSDREQRTFYGTLLVFMLAFPTAASVILHLLGEAGALDVFATVRFHPHLRLVLWTAYAQSFLPLPTALYMVREQPSRVAILTVTAAITQLGLTLLYVVSFQEGLMGALRAALHSSLVTATLAIYLVARNASLSFSPAILRKALGFSVPLVPHALGAWVLSISDRLVLERYVSAEDLGRYSIGYLFAFAVSLFAQSITTPLGPAANRQLKDETLKHNVPPLGTYAFLSIALAGLVAAVFAPDVIRVIVPPTYYGAEGIVPWVVLGSVFQGVYFIWSTGTWFSMKTRLIPVVTAIGAVSNLAMNLAFIPRFGILAAAVTTAIAYGLMAALHGLLAHKMHPIRWENRRWAAIALIAVATYMCASLLPSSPVALVAKGALVMGALGAASAAAGLQRLRKA